MHLCDWKYFCECKYVIIIVSPVNCGVVLWCMQVYLYINTQLIRPNSGQWPDTIMQSAKDFREPRNESQPSHILKDEQVVGSIITPITSIDQEQNSLFKALCHKTPVHSSTDSFNIRLATRWWTLTIKSPG